MIKHPLNSNNMLRQLQINYRQVPTHYSSSSNTELFPQHTIPLEIILHRRSPYPTSSHKLRLLNILRPTFHPLRPFLENRDEFSSHSQLVLRLNQSCNFQSPRILSFKMDKIGRNQLPDSSSSPPIR